MLTCVVCGYVFCSLSAEPVSQTDVKKTTSVIHGALLFWIAGESPQPRGLPHVVILLNHVALSLLHKPHSIFSTPTLTKLHVGKRGAESK